MQATDFLSQIIVLKSRKILQYWHADTIMQFPIGIGRNPIGTKRIEGDGKTPEGQYQICVKNPNSKFYLSLGLDYPNVQDAKFGLASQTIDLKTYESIVSADLPSWKTALGGEIYIHGELEIRRESEGCIRMYNSHMKELYDQVELGTPVFIFA